MRKSSFLHLVILGILVLVSIALYLGYHLPNRWQYALTNRALSVTAIIVTGIAIALATMLFQTVVNNRILTPSILGVDSLYLLIQTGILFLFGSNTLLSLNPITLFLGSTGVMIGLLCLRSIIFLFKKESQNIFFFIARRNCVWHVFWQSDDLYGSID